MEPRGHSARPLFQAVAGRAVAHALVFAALSVAQSAHAQCPQPLPCDAAPADQIACLESNYSFFDDPQNNGVREQDQTSEGLARVVSIRPRVSGSSEANAGYLALRADSTIVALPPGINGAEMMIEGYWRRSVVIATAGPPLSPIGTMVGLFSWRGGIEQIAVPLTEQAGIPLNGAHAAAMLQIGALDETCYPVAEIVRTDSSCSGRRVLEVPPCGGDAFVDEILQVEVPFTFGRPFHLFGYARLDADVENLDSALADEFFGGARADFGNTGRWMGILEVRDFLGAPVADYTITDLANPAIDWTQPVPVPEPDAATQAWVALALLASIPRRRRFCHAAARVILPCALVADSARAEVTWVPYDAGPDFVAIASAGTSEYGATLCPVPEGDGCFTGEDEEASDVLTTVPSFGTRAAQAEASADSGGARAATTARYLVSWEELGPNSHVGHVELEIFGETLTNDPPPENSRSASSFAEARAYLCFRVEDQPVELRLFGTWVGAPTDLYPDFTAADGGQIQAPGHHASIEVPGVFDTGSNALLPVGGAYCITASLFADEYLFADDEVSSPPQTETASLAFDFTILPVPEPGAGAAIATAIAALWLLRSRGARRNGFAVLAVATLLVAPSPARAFVRLSPQHPPTAWVASSFDLIDSSSPECIEVVCVAQLRDLATFALLDAPAGTVSFEDGVPAFEAELDQSYAVQFTFEDTPLGPTLVGGSASIISASRGIADPSPVPGLEGATMTGLVGLDWTVEVTAPVYLYVFGNAALIGGPLEDREIGDPNLCPPLPLGVLCRLRPYPEVRVGPTPFHFAPTQESELGTFDSGELVLASGVYGFSAIAGNANAVPIVAGASETHLVQEDLDVEFVIVPVPEPGATHAAPIALAVLALCSKRRRVIGTIALAIGATPLAADADVTFAGFQKRSVSVGVSLIRARCGLRRALRLCRSSGVRVRPAAAADRGAGRGRSLLHHARARAGCARARPCGLARPACANALESGPICDPVVPTLAALGIGVRRR